MAIFELEIGLGFRALSSPCLAACRLQSSDLAMAAILGRRAIGPTLSLLSQRIESGAAASIAPEVSSCPRYPAEGCYLCTALNVSTGQSGLTLGLSRFREYSLRFAGAF